LCLTFAHVTSLRRCVAQCVLLVAAMWCLVCNTRACGNCFQLTRMQIQNAFLFWSGWCASLDRAFDHSNASSILLWTFHSLRFFSPHMSNLMFGNVRRALARVPWKLSVSFAATGVSYFLLTRSLSLCAYDVRMYGSAA